MIVYISTTIIRNKTCYNDSYLYKAPPGTYFYRSPLFDKEILTIKCWHLPIFTPRRQGTIFGTTELNFRVRYGNGWTLSVIDTNYFRNRSDYSTGYPLCQRFSRNSEVIRTKSSKAKGANLLFTPPLSGKAL